MHKAVRARMAAWLPHNCSPSSSTYRSIFVVDFIIFTASNCDFWNEARDGHRIHHFTFVLDTEGKEGRKKTDKGTVSPHNAPRRATSVQSSAEYYRATFLVNTASTGLGYFWVTVNTQLFSSHDYVFSSCLHLLLPQLLPASPFPLPLSSCLEMLCHSQKPSP